MISRRDFLSVLGLTLLAGCGSSSQSGPSGAGPIPDSELRSLRVSLHPSDFGKLSGRVLSLYGPDQSITGNGSVQVPVRSDSVQLLVLEDLQGRIRGMAVTGAEPSIEISALTTVQALVVMTPGLSAGDFSLMRQRIEAVESAPLLGLLGPSLAESSLDELLTRAYLQDAHTRAVFQLLERFPLPAPSPNPGRVEVVLDAATDKLLLTNSGYRHVNVIRQDIDSSGQLLAEVALGLVMPALPGQLEDLYRQTPSPQVLEAARPGAGITSRFWFYGAGSVVLSATPPVPGPPPPAFNPTPQNTPPSVSMAEMIFIMGELSSSTLSTAIGAEEQYNNLINQVLQSSQSQPDEPSGEAEKLRELLFRLEPYLQILAGRIAVSPLHGELIRKAIDFVVSHRQVFHELPGHLVAGLSYLLQTAEGWYLDHRA